MDERTRLVQHLWPIVGASLRFGDRLRFVRRNSDTFRRVAASSSNSTGFVDFQLARRASGTRSTEARMFSTFANCARRWIHFEAILTGDVARLGPFWTRSKALHSWRQWTTLVVPRADGIVALDGTRKATRNVLRMWTSTGSCSIVDFNYHYHRQTNANNDFERSLPLGLHGFASMSLGYWTTMIQMIEMRKRRIVNKSRLNVSKFDSMF